MTEVIKAIVYICIGSGLGIVLLGFISLNRRVEMEQKAYWEGRTDGYREGYKAGDRDGYKAGIRRVEAMLTNRIDAGKGNDSIRPS